ncbi:MAG: TldD/PmbA family protein [Candidatus Nanoarchaeia archaeon]|nr:TldD/PmbA family protein [Candidatus Nanoarchaeia archaeon]
MKELLKKIINEGNKLGYVEAGVAVQKSSELEYENELVRNVKNLSLDELRIRITLKDGRCGVSISSPEEWKKCLDDAYTLAKISNPDKDFKSIPELKKAFPVKKQFLKLISSDNLIKFSDELINSAKKYDKRISIEDISISQGNSNLFLMNSNNIYNNEESGLLSASLSVKCGGTNAFESHSSFNMFKPREIAEKASELCINSLNPKKYKTVKTSVIMDYYAFSSLVSACLVGSLSGYNVQKKRSVFAEKMGEKVMDEKITIIDNGLMENGLFTSSRDSEGVPQQKTVLIDKGVIRNFMYDTYTALKENKESTGNCGSISSRPSVEETNFIIKKGDISFEEIVKDVKNGLYVTNVIGEHTVNPVSGDFSLPVINSFSVKNGEMSFPVKDTMISGNFFELLKNVRYIGNKYRQENSVVCPVVCFDNVQAVC